MALVFVTSSVFQAVCYLLYKSILHSDIIVYNYRKKNNSLILSWGTLQILIIMQWYISIPVKFCSSLRSRPCSEPRTLSSVWSRLCSLNPSPECSLREKSHSPAGHSIYSHVHSPPSKLLSLSLCCKPGRMAQNI